MNINFKTATIIIMILNFIDGILTYLGIYFGYAYEKNALIVDIMSNLYGVLFIKLLLPTLLLFMVYKIISQNQISTFIKILIIAALVAYMFIFLNHIYVLIQFFIYLF